MKISAELATAALESATEEQLAQLRHDALEFAEEAANAAAAKHLCMPLKDFLPLGETVGARVIMAQQLFMSKRSELLNLESGSMLEHTLHTAAVGTLATRTPLAQVRLLLAAKAPALHHDVLAQTLGDPGMDRLIEVLRRLA